MVGVRLDLALWLAGTHLRLGTQRPHLWNTEWPPSPPPPSPGNVRCLVEGGGPALSLQGAFIHSLPTSHQTLTLGSPRLPLVLPCPTPCPGPSPGQALSPKGTGRRKETRSEERIR